MVARQLPHNGKSIYAVAYMKYKSLINNKKQNRMKNIKISIVAAIAVYTMLAAGLSSCGNEQPVLNGKTPFVVTEIKEYNETHASYYGKWNTDMGTRNNLFGSWTPRIVLPKGYYNIGDTIVFVKPCH